MNETSDRNLLLLCATSPYIEIAFYYRSVASVQERFRDFLHNLNDNHIGKLVGIGYSRYLDRAYLHRFNLEELEARIMREENCLHTVCIEDLVGNNRNNRYDIITYRSMYSRYLAKNEQIITIQTESDPLEAHNDDSFAKGNRVYKVLMEICHTTEPTYASISIEEPLEPPLALHELGASATLYNFFVNHNFVNQKQLAIMEELYKGAYIERVKQGTYFSCNQFFNPDKVQNKNIKLRELVKTLMKDS